MAVAGTGPEAPEVGGVVTVQIGGLPPPRPSGAGGRLGAAFFGDGDVEHVGGVLLNQERNVGRGRSSVEKGLTDEVAVEM